MCDVCHACTSYTFCLHSKTKQSPEPRNTPVDFHVRPTGLDSGLEEEKSLKCKEKCKIACFVNAETLVFSRHCGVLTGAAGGAFLLQELKQSEDR